MWYCSIFMQWKLTVILMFYLSAILTALIQTRNAIILLNPLKIMIRGFILIPKHRGGVQIQKGKNYL